MWANQILPLDFALGMLRTYEKQKDYDVGKCQRMDLMPLFKAMWSQMQGSSVYGWVCKDSLIGLEKMV